MIYDNTAAGIFLARPNRFIAHVEIDGRIAVAHVKNTGRCKELLVPGARVILHKQDSPARKTPYDLIAVWKGERLINIDSQAPNKVFWDYLQSGRHLEGIICIKAEAKYGNSRFDFYVEAEGRKIFIEVKGVTLEEGGVALFPDAPTVRGVKHLGELARCVRDGYEAQVVFVIQMRDVEYFTPNNKMHLAFGEALIAAKQTGVKVSALDCVVTENSLSISEAIPVKLI
ncbi:MAG: DNA/RNA nuclease SfsA [Dehalococcoidia bacterium]|nr:DNA/RNA nuclease SfsA [Dehalococcoidia bacterium]